jgi:hypothetical protein
MTKKSILQHLFIGLIFVCLTAGAAFAQTTAFTYQGKLNNNGAEANGIFEIQFTLFDAAADGTQIGVIVTDPSVTVMNGIFATTLDFGAAAFDGSARFLEIGVRPAGDKNPFTTLIPRSAVNSTPYSVRSTNATTADNSNQLGGVAASEYVTTTTVGNSFIKNDTTLQTANFNINGNGFVGGNLGIGTIAPTSKLQVFQGNGYGFTQTDGTTTVGSFINSRGGWLGTKSNHPLNFFTNDSQPQMTLTTSGNLGIGTTTPTPGIRLDVNGDVLMRNLGSGGNMQFGTPNAESGMSIVSLIGRADYRYDGTTLKMVVNGGGGPPSSVNGIAINNSGKVGIGTNTPQAKFNVVGTSWFQGDTTPLPASAGKGIIVGFSGESGYISSFDYGTFTPKNLLLNLGGGNVGIGTTNPQAKLDVAGVIKTNTLQIIGGSDLAEKFEITKVFKNGKEVSIPTIKSGIVVAIDPRQAGKLVLSRSAYNRRVAGVISGANNLSAGLLLPNLTDTKDAQPIALSGRVWVYADATRNSIAPGDLLTTSATPGHAMKVMNYRKAQGAIIGKAMSSLKSGRGLVLVLITLQ